MPDFDSFVVLAEMRTGSNFLESNLNALDGVTCHGEAFNPHFIGSPKDAPILGVDRAVRDAAPLDLLARLRAAPGLHGFRYFSDHDPRLFAPLMEAPRIAKIVLTRNPAESYVSHRIAAATGQWKLTDARHARAERVPSTPPASSGIWSACGRRSYVSWARCSAVGRAPSISITTTFRIWPCSTVWPLG